MSRDGFEPSTHSLKGSGAGVKGELAGIEGEESVGGSRAGAEDHRILHRTSGSAELCPKAPSTDGASPSAPAGRILLRVSTRL